MRRRTVAAWALCCVALAAAGCSRKEEPAPVPTAGVSAAPGKEPAASSTRPKLFVKIMEGAGKDLARPVVRYANWTDKPIAAFELRVYSYDRAGAQLSAPHPVIKKPVRPIRPGEIREIETDLGTIPPGAAVEIVVPRIVFTDDSTWSDERLAPEQRPKGG